MPAEKELPLTFGGINENNVAQLRLLNDVIFPVKYHDKFYTDVVTLPPEFAKFGEWMYVCIYVCVVHPCRSVPSHGRSGSHTRQPDTGPHTYAAGGGFPPPRWPGVLS
jgi:hypothetical protein